MAPLFIAKGVHGVNKLHISRGTGSRIIVFFLGDRVEHFGLDPEINKLQDPSNICDIFAAKAGPESTVVVVQPSHLEACCARYRHFFKALTLTGEPLGYKPQEYKASEQLQSLLENANVFNPAADSQHTDIIGFSKGGILVNQVHFISNAYVHHLIHTNFVLLLN